MTELAGMETTTQIDFLVLKDLFDNSPFPLRDNQPETLQKIGEALRDPKIKFVIVQAPTGSGKSLLAVASGRSTDSAYAMTANKGLQDQYGRDFSQYLADLRGRSNYKCNRHENKTCSDSPCRLTPAGRKECSKLAMCEYSKAISKAKSADITLFNFSSALAFLNHTEDMFGIRALNIIDEAHMIEDQLTSFIEFSVPIDQLRELGLISQVANIPDLGGPAEYLEFLTGMMQIGQHLIESGKFEGPVTFEKVETVTRKLQGIVGEVRDYPGNLIMDKEFDLYNNLVKIIFRPFKVDRYAKDYLFKYSNKTLMLSATILDPNAFMRSLGIDPAEAVYIDVPSTFPAANRPIIRKYVGALNFRNMQEMIPKIVKSTVEILDKHKDEKGIIHTPSYALAQAIYDGLSPKLQARVLFPLNSREQAFMLDLHKDSEIPTVFLSPAMAEGVDLKDDLSRFQIITKIPYPSTQDKVVKARMEADKGWYGYKTMLKIIQSYGRSVRSSTDTATTYILDGQFDRLLADYGRMLPRWFLEAISRNVV